MGRKTVAEFYFCVKNIPNLKTMFQDNVKIKKINKKKEVTENNHKMKQYS